MPGVAAPAAGSAAPELRVAQLNDAAANAAFCDNSISTSKYTLLSFVPLSLFEQLRRVANLYFLVIVVLMLIGTYATEVFQSPLTPYSTLVPLVIVLAITMAKEGAEDWKRHSGDATTNSRTAPVAVASGEARVAWRDIAVGTVVRVNNRDEVPADLIVLASSEDKGICYVETSNIDGETNLKLRESVGVPGLCASLCSEAGAAEPHTQRAAGLAGTLKYEQPNDRIHTFTGALTLEGGTYGVDAKNVLLRGCTLRNTKWVLGLVAYTGRESKVMKKSGGARFKMSAVEQVMNKCILLIFLAQAALCTIATIAEVLWRTSRLGTTPYLGSDVSNAYVIPLWLANWFTFLLLFNNFIPISLYVTVEMVNYAQAFLVNSDPLMWDADTDTPARARTSTLNTDLGQIQYVFSDKTGTLTRNVMEFKRCSVAGRIHGRFALEGGSSGSSSGGSGGGDAAAGVAGDVEAGGAGGSASGGASPLGLTENRVYAHSSSDGAGPPPCDSGLDDPALVALLRGNGNANLDPAVYYGKWWRGSGGEAALPAAPPLGAVVRGPGTSQVAYTDHEAYALEAFFTCLAVCHTVVPEAAEGGRIVYQAESPDEGALVGTAADLGIRFVERRAEAIVLERSSAYKGAGSARPAARHVWRVFGVHQFNSTRKRMGCVVQAPDGRKMLLVKGADNVMLERATFEAGGAGEAARGALVAHLKLFGEQGLRTLVIGQRLLSEGEFAAWQASFTAASIALVDREDALAAVAEAYERDLTLLGASGVEDRLQDDVPSAIEDIRRAGVKVWVLTGDKVETAINIGYSARLLDDSMQQLVVDAEDLGVLRAQLLELQTRLACEPLPVPVTLYERALGGGGAGLAAAAAAARARRDPALTKPAIIITGPALSKILGDPVAEPMLLRVADVCGSVLACRTSPAQKAKIVEMVKLGVHPTPITLAIGDGANDVGMIMRADVGVGISGKEGLQAANAADFSIAQFKFLRRLMLVHGRWDYRRMSKVVLYSFYKNVVITLTLFFFNALASFSGTSLYQSTIYSVFNFMLGLPIIAIGILDQDVPEGVVLKHPSLYRQGRDNLDMNISQVLQWLVYAVVHSLLVFWLPYASFSTKDTAWEPGTGYSQGIDVRGLAIFCAMTWAMQLSVSLNTLSWTHWNWGVIAFSQVVFYVFCAVLASSVAFSYDFVGVAARAFSSAPFYLNMGLVCAALTLLDLGLKGARLALAPQACETARVWHSLGVWREEDGSAADAGGAKNLTAPRPASQEAW